MMPGSSGASWKSVGAGCVPDKFPAGLRVLVVDDDPTCLVILEKMLKKCNYEVTTCNRAEIGLSLLRENKKGYDIVLSDVHMPDMDGFKLLEHIGLEMDLPVIMMSVDDSSSVVMKVVTHGACDYLIKPVRLEALRNIWQHVVRRRKNKWKDFDSVTSADDVGQHQKVPEDADYTSSVNKGHNWKDAKSRRDEEDDSEERDESSSSKNTRVIWSLERHQQFVSAVNQLGIDKAVPKKILELMNVPGLSRENVASHLQKYRLYLRRVSLHQFQHHSFTGVNVNNQVLMPMPGQGQSQSRSQNQPVLPNGILGHELGTKVSGTGIVPSYNVLNDPNQTRPVSGFPNLAFNDWLTYPSCNKMGPYASLATDEESGANRNGAGDNQDDLLSAILKQVLFNIKSLMMHCYTCTLCNDDVS